MSCLDFKKRHIKGEKHITQMDFAEYLRKSDVSENTEIGFMKGIDEMYKILKSLLANRFWSRDEGGIG